MKKPACFSRQPNALGSLLLIAIFLSVPTSPLTLAQDTSAGIFDALQVVRLEEPPPAPAFSLPAVDDTIHALEDYKGKLVFLNFWTTW